MKMCFRTEEAKAIRKQSVFLDFKIILLAVIFTGVQDVPV